jgi:DNA-binding NarL/FixJ family response regulator
MEKRHRPKILIADDHTLVAQACKRLLEPECDVIAIVSDGRALVQAAKELSPDVVILDISMPELNGLDAGEQVKSRNPSTNLIYLTMALEPEVAAEAFRRGASGYVLKQDSANELLIAVRRVLRGESYLSSLITKDTVAFLLRSRSRQEERKRLSTRQSEVLQLLVEGKSMKEIAYILDVTKGSVAFHKYRIMEILGVKTNAALVHYAFRRHIISGNKTSGYQ